MLAYKMVSNRYYSYIKKEKKYNHSSIIVFFDLLFLSFENYWFAFVSLLMHAFVLYIAWCVFDSFSHLCESEGWHTFFFLFPLSNCFYCVCSSSVLKCGLTQKSEKVDYVLKLSKLSLVA